MQSIAQELSARCTQVPPCKLRRPRCEWCEIASRITFAAAAVKAIRLLRSRCSHVPPCDPGSARCKWCVDADKTQIEWSEDIVIYNEGWTDPDKVWVRFRDVSGGARRALPSVGNLFRRLDNLIEADLA